LSSSPHTPTVSRRVVPYAASFGGDLLQQIGTLIRYGDPDSAAASWSLFQPGLVFTPEALLCAVTTGIVLALPALGIGRLFRSGGRRATAT